MRTAIAALVATVLLNPAAVVAADLNQAEPTFERLNGPAPQKGAKAKAKNSEAARPDSTLHDPATERHGNQAGTAAPCSSTPSKDVAKRCLRLTELAPPPAPVSVAKPTMAVLPSTGPFAGPSRSWLGAFSKYVVNEVVDVAEALYTDRDNWRARMTSEVQWELDRARQKAQSKPKQNVGQAAPPAAPNGAQPGRGAKS